MLWRDMGRYLYALLGVSVAQLLTYLTGWRQPNPSDFNEACIIAALFVVLMAIREPKDTPR